VLKRRTRRAATAAAALLAVVALSGCGAPANLDGQEKEAFARACTSLIERNIVQANPPVKELGGEQLNLDDPTEFYDTLERLRGPDSFSFDDPSKLAQSPKDQLDTPCRPENPTRK
jgi:hypothetical protein